MSLPKKICITELENFSLKSSQPSPSSSSIKRNVVVTPNKIISSILSSPQKSPSLLSSASSELPNFDDVIKYGHLFDAGAAIFSEYCEYSTIHGVRYLGERKRTWIEKIFWIIVFIISIYICTTLIIDIWIKWNDTPVIVNFADKATPVWKIPFPTITICLDIKSTSDIFRFDDHVKEFNMNESIFDEWTNYEKQLMDISLQICDYTKTNDFDEYTNKIFHGSSSSSFLNGIEYMAPNRDKIFLYTTFLDESLSNNVSDSLPYFDRILTEKGICYTFNSLDLKTIYRDNVAVDELLLLNEFDRKTQWTLENGYNGLAKNEEYPYRTYSAFYEHGLKVILAGQIDDTDAVCGEGDDGLKITINTPGDIPQLSRQFISVPFNYEVLIAVTPDLTTISNTAADYSPQIRQCFFDSEKYLKFFKTYSQANCELECLTNYTLQKCGCVRFNMPRNKGTPVCGAKSITCYLEAKKELLEFEFLRNNVNMSRKQIIPDCECLPTCTSLFYKIGVTQAPISSAVQHEGQKVTKLQIYYKDDQFWSSERSKIYGPIQFTANAGGLLGLFMGISVISVVEIFYYLSVRFFGHLKLRYCMKNEQKISRLGE